MRSFLKVTVFVLIPLILVFVVSKIDFGDLTDDTITKIIRENIPDSIPIKNLSAHLTDKHSLKLSGLLYDKIPIECDFAVQFNNDSIILQPKKIYANGFGLPISYVSSFLDIENGEILLRIHK